MSGPRSSPPSSAPRPTAGPTPRVGVPLCYPYIVETNATTEKPGPHTNGTLCVVRSTRTLWYWNNAWGRVTL